MRYKVEYAGTVFQSQRYSAKHVRHRRGKREVRTGNGLRMEVRQHTPAMPSFVKKNEAINLSDCTNIVFFYKEIGTEFELVGIMLGVMPGTIGKFH